MVMQNIAIPARQAAASTAHAGTNTGPAETSASSQALPSMPREEHVYIHRAYWQKVPQKAIMHWVESS